MVEGVEPEVVKLWGCPVHGATDATVLFKIMLPEGERENAYCCQRVSERMLIAARG